MEMHFNPQASPSHDVSRGSLAGIKDVVMANYFDLIVLAISLACFEVALSCDPPDCDHPDCGTCGKSAKNVST